ncbi:hypothetical protein F5Y17DRAFT_457423 [Xylariaceae sp. FL0594]|nr:hypothetical protein F5Y17DRAFT_457423 [Xylariaceae sp. FL0594]
MKVAKLVSQADLIRHYDEIMDVADELEKALDENRLCMSFFKRAGDATHDRRLWLAQVNLDITIRRPLLALYRPFVLGSADAPQRVVTGYLRSCMVILTYWEGLDESSPTYSDNWHFYYLLFKRDIFHATFGVCYYLENVQLDVTPFAEWTQAAENQQATKAACRAASESSMSLCLPRLRRTVERVIIDMVRRVSEIGMNMKELVALTVVFYSFQRGPREAYDPESATARALERILEAGVEFLRATEPPPPPPPSRMPPPPLQHQQQFVIMDFHPDKLGSEPAEQYMLAPDVPNAFLDGFDIWNIDVWDGVVAR